MLLINQDVAIGNVRNIIKGCDADTAWDYLIRGNIIYSPLLNWDPVRENMGHVDVLMMATGPTQDSFVKLLGHAVECDESVAAHVRALRPVVETLIQQPIFNIFRIFKEMIPLQRYRKMILLFRQIQILQKFFSLEKNTTITVGNLEPDVDGVQLPRELVDATVYVQIPPHKTTPWFFGLVPIGRCRWKETPVKLEVVSF
ncbi:ORF52 [black bullhead herpesvirus]|uniref:ORF52 n=1 Tax=black bullhead herpesvirus TaxID=508441 RepID=A0A2H5AJJ8_9VIRU|nr:ORF52 [black bullhead herpesvirus]AUG72307.1 ORF52 [black bullhead herpesvirus]